jgi:hypothetical protein
MDLYNEIEKIYNLLEDFDNSYIGEEASKRDPELYANTFLAAKDLIGEILDKSNFKMV